MKTMRLGLVQNHPAYGDPAGNLAAVERAIEGVPPPGADLWILPELFASGYVFGSRAECLRLAEPVPDGPTCRGLVRLAARSGASIVAGVPERAADGSVFNSAIAIDPRAGVSALYRKIHLFDYEKEWFDPGQLGFIVTDLAGARVGLMICFDWRFPEAARTLALSGAQVIAHPSNLVHPQCQDAMVTRALENRVFIATANRIGTEARAGIELTFTGRSRIVGHDGSVLHEAPIAETATAVVEIDPRLADDKTVTAHNDLFGDRRPGFYRA
jgi:predicted amidohydrolase